MNCSLRCMNCAAAHGKAIQFMERSEKSCCKAAIHDPKGQIIKASPITTAPPITHYTTHQSRRGEPTCSPEAPPSNRCLPNCLPHCQLTTSPFEGGHRGLLLALPSNRCLSVCLLPPKSTFSIEEQATEKSCHSEEGVSPTWESVPLNVSIIWEFGIKRRVLRIRIATATGGLAMTVRNLIPYS